MADENPVLNADPPETPAAGTAVATAMDDLAKSMTSAFNGPATDATPPVDGEGGLKQEEPTIESETVTDTTKDDSANATEPEPEAKPEPVTLTERQKQGAKVLRMTEEQLVDVDEDTSKLLDEVGQKYQSAMGTIGNMVKTAKKTTGAETEPDGEDGQDDPPAETGDEPAATGTPADLNGIVDEFDSVDTGRLVAALQGERTRSTDLEARLTSVTEQQEELLVDSFIGTLDKATFSHLGEGPTWRLDRDSPEYKARKDMQQVASAYALGVQVTEGKPITMLEALARTTNGAEKIRDSALKKKAAGQAKAQRHGIHEPGRAVVNAPDPAKKAMDKLAKVQAEAFGS